MDAHERFTILLETMMQALETAVFAAIAVAIIMGIVLILVDTTNFALMLGGASREEFVKSTDLKDYFLSILDMSLVLIIGLDILRTIVVGILEREFHAVAALEAAILAMVREIIGAEIRHRTVSDLIGYVSVLVLLVAAWILTREGILREAGARKAREASANRRKHE